MEYRRRILPWVLIALGVAMALVAMVLLWQTPNVLQYTILAPEAGENGSGVEASMTKAQDVITAQHTNFRAMALDGHNGSVRVASETNTVEANLIAMGEGWLEVYPRFLVQGRRISELELQNGTAVMMMDEGLVVKLFGSALPDSATVKLNEVEYRVVGTVRHGGSVFGGRGVGDAVSYDVYIPLKAALANGISIQTMTMSAAPKGGSGWTSTFQTVAAQWTVGGSLIDLSKEVMRRMMLLRILLLIVGMYALLGLFIRVTDRVMGWFEGYRQALRRHYFREMIPRLLGIVALTLLCYGALVGAAWLLLSFSVQPVYTFTEWVPDNFVEWSSITRVFWNLVTESATLVRIGTRELRVVEFWGTLLRWGVILALLGMALLPKAWQGKRKDKY